MLRSPGLSAALCSTCLHALLGAMLCALTLPASALADTESVDIRTRKTGNAVSIDATAQVSASAGIVWKVLTDYDRIADFLPEFTTSRVIARDGTRIIIAQQGAARFLWFSFPIDVVVESVEEAPRRIRMRMLSGNLAQLRGQYEVDTSSDRAVTTIRWTGIIEPRDALPPLIGRAILHSNLEDQFRALLAEIERRERSPTQ
jgi:ribosome-associated toxin RatA of RatAB toxin-antitoxin module